MKTICKNIAFSETGKCLLGDKCICEENKLWIEEDHSKPDEIPEELQEWVSQWLLKHVESAPIDLDEHVRVTTFCRAIVYQAYRHFSKLGND